MKLFYTSGACSLAPHIVLRELDLPFELEEVDLRTKTTATGTDFTTINPKGYVPALQLDDGEVLTEAAAIMQYLADRYAPGTLAPTTGTIERAHLDGHLNFISAELHKAFGPLFDPAIILDTRNAVVANLRRKLGMVETVLADGRAYLTGSAFSIADAYLIAVLRWTRQFGIDLAPWPELSALIQRGLARSAVRTAMGKEGLLESI